MEIIEAVVTAVVFGLGGGLPVGAIFNYLDDRK